MPVPATFRPPWRGHPTDGAAGCLSRCRPSRCLSPLAGCLSPSAECLSRCLSPVHVEGACPLAVCPRWSACLMSAGVCSGLARRAASSLPGCLSLGRCVPWQVPLAGCVPWQSACPSAGCRVCSGLARRAAWPLPGCLSLGRVPVPRRCALGGVLGGVPVPEPLPKPLDAARCPATNGSGERLEGAQATLRDLAPFQHGRPTVREASGFRHPVADATLQRERRGLVDGAEMPGA